MDNELQSIDKDSTSPHSSSPGLNLSSRRGSTTEPDYGDEEGKGIFPRIIDSFRRQPGATVTPKELFTGGRHMFDAEAAAAGTANNALARVLKGRHLQMIAIGGSIGNIPCLILKLLF